MTETIWIVGRALPGPASWALMGAFVTEAEAVQACRDQYYFVGEMPFGVALPHDPETFPGAYYPLWEEK